MVCWFHQRYRPTALGILKYQELPISSPKCLDSIGSLLCRVILYGSRELKIVVLVVLWTLLHVLYIEFVISQSFPYTFHLFIQYLYPTSCCAQKSCLDISKRAREMHRGTRAFRSVLGKIVNASILHELILD